MLSMHALILLMDLGRDDVRNMVTFSWASSAGSSAHAPVVATASLLSPDLQSREAADFVLNFKNTYGDSPCLLSNCDLTS